MPSPYDALPERHGFIFTGNAAQGGTFVAPNYGNAAPFAPPMPQLQSAWDSRNPTFAQQQFYAPPPTPQAPLPPRQDRPQPPTADVLPAMPGTLRDTMRGGASTTPLPMPGSNPQSAPRPGPQPPLPNFYDAPGPAGRSLQQVQGTPFLSAQERDWFYSQAGAAQQSGPSTMSQPQGGAQPISPPATGDAGMLQAYAQRAATQSGFDPTLFSNLIAHESQWNPAAVNPASGASGLGQFLPSTAANYGVSPQQLVANPQLALDLSARMLGELSQQFGGNQQMALAAYFIGPKNIMDAIQAGGPNWLGVADQIAQRYGQGSVSQYLSALGALSMPRR